MKRILLVDDEIMTRTLIENYLSKKGYHVLTAKDGDHAIRIMKKHTPDLVITDIIMPEKNGIELILEIQKNYPGLAIIAISGGGKINADTHLSIAKDLGVNFILSKPIQNTELDKALESVFKKT